MKTKTTFSVMTAAACMPSTCMGTYGRIAVVEHLLGQVPKQIHSRHKSVIRIVETWERLNRGTTDRCAFAKAHAEAEALAEKLNKGAK